MYRLDFDRTTGDYRMIDNIHIEVRPISALSHALPETDSSHAVQPPLPLPLHSTLSDTRAGRPQQRKMGESAGGRAKAVRDYGALNTVGTWPPEMSVFTACWHPAQRLSPLLATGMACGLVRVDWCEGAETRN